MTRIAVLFAVALTLAGIAGASANWSRAEIGASASWDQVTAASASWNRALGWD